MEKKTKTMSYVGPNVTLDWFNDLGNVTINAGTEVEVKGDDTIVAVKKDRLIKVTPYFVSPKYLVKKRPETIKFKKGKLPDFWHIDEHEPWTDIWKMQWEAPLAKEAQEIFDRSFKQILDSFNADHISFSGKDQFDAILAELQKLHSAKNHDYGNSFTDLFKECGMIYAYGHLKEKLNRIKGIMDSEAQVKGEKLEDSLKDLASYAIMTLVELRSKDNGTD